MPPRIRVMLVVMICLALGACAVSSPQAGQTPSPTSRLIPTDTPPADTFYFTTEDGVTLNGQVIGSGKTALVFSNGQTVSKFFWLPVAQRLASQGYLCLLYDYRGLSPSQGQNDLSRRDSDLRAAVGVARARGATSVVLVGASFGGTLTLALAAQIQPKAVIILSAPLSADAFTVSEAGLKALTETGSSPPHATGLQPQWSGVSGLQLTIAPTLPISRRSGRIASYGPTNSTQDLQVQTRAHSYPGARAGACAGPVPLALQHRLRAAHHRLPSCAASHVSRYAAGSRTQGHPCCVS